MTEEEADALEQLAREAMPFILKEMSQVNNMRSLTQCQDVLI